MRPYLVQKHLGNLQGSLYFKLNNFSQSNKIAGRFCSIPISILDVALDTLKIPLTTIESVARASINLIGATFSNEYTLKDALAYTERALGSIAVIPVKLVMAPIKITFQFFAIIINPEKVQSISQNTPAKREA